MICAIQNDDFESATIAPHIRTGIPGADWSLEELDARAVWENDQIRPRERHAAHYWFLGRALLVVGRDFDSAQWNRWRATHKINRTRCERSQLLARAFDSADDVAHLAVLAAVALAGQRLGLPPRQTLADAKLRRRLVDTDKTLQKILDELASVRRAAGVRPLIAKAMRKLTAIDRACIALESPTPKRAKPATSVPSAQPPAVIVRV